MVRQRRSTGNVKRRAVQQRILCALQALPKGLWQGHLGPCVSACEHGLVGMAPWMLLLKTNAGTAACEF